MPFILRATNLIGINAENTSNYEREKIVSDLEKFSKLKKLNKIFKICKLKEFNNKKNILFGRLIVKIN